MIRWTSLLFAAVGLSCSSDSKHPPPSVQEQLYESLLGRVEIWNGVLSHQNESEMLVEIQKNSQLVMKHLDTLKQDAESSSARERMLACFALGFASDPAVLPILLRSLDHPSPVVRGNAIGATGLLVFRKIISPDKAPMEAYARLLKSKSWVDVAGTLFTLSLVLTEDNDGGFSEEIAPLLKHPRPEVRLEAVKLAGVLKKPASYEKLREGLNDPEPYVRLNVLKALAQIGKEKAIPDLVLGLSDAAPDVVKIAVTLLESVAPKGLEFVCEADRHSQASNGTCPTCGKTLVPRARR